MKKILILGGTRYFGKRLALRLAEQGHKVTLLSRGQSDDGLGSLVARLRADRSDEAALKEAVGTQEWDMIYDQVAYDDEQARAAVRLFAGRVGRYVFTSSAAVYGVGPTHPESDFDAANFRFEPKLPVQNYQDGKRRAEAVFAQAPFPVVSLRLPFVLGEDDYTQRLAFYVRRVLQGEPIHVPNPEARVSFIHADDAARALHRMEKLQLSGPLNAASPEPLTLKHLLGLVSAGARRPWVPAAEATPENSSPYGAAQDYVLDTQRAQAHGLRLRHIKDWLPELVELELRRHRQKF